MSKKETEESLELAKTNLDLAIGWIGHADSKATFYLTIAMAMLGASLTEVPTLVKVCKHLFASSPILMSLLILIHAVFYGSALFSAYMALEVVKPRLAPDSKTHSWFFFQSIAQFGDLKKWQEFTSGLEVSEKHRHLVDQIWNISRVAVSKYQKAGASDIGLRVATVSGILAIVITLVTGEVVGE